MNSWFEDRFFSTCFKIRLQENRRESTTGQQRTLRNNSMNFAPQTLCWQKLSRLLEVLQGCALCLVCRHIAQRAPVRQFFTPFVNVYCEED